VNHKICKPTLSYISFNIFKIIQIIFLKSVVFVSLLMDTVIALDSFSSHCGINGISLLCGIIRNGSQ